MGKLDFVKSLLNSSVIEGIIVEKGLPLAVNLIVVKAEAVISQVKEILLSEKIKLKNLAGDKYDQESVDTITNGAKKVMSSI